MAKSSRKVLRWITCLNYHNIKDGVLNKLHIQLSLIRTVLKSLRERKSNVEFKLWSATFIRKICSVVRKYFVVRHVTEVPWFYQEILCDCCNTLKETFGDRWQYSNVSRTHHHVHFHGFFGTNIKKKKVDLSLCLIENRYRIEDIISPGERLIFVVLNITTYIVWIDYVYWP